MSLLPENLRYLRSSKKFSLAKMSLIFSIPRRAWSNYEKGIDEPKATVLLKIANYFELFMNDLMWSDLEKEQQESDVKIKFENERSTEMLIEKATANPREFITIDFDYLKTLCGGMKGN